MATDIARQIEKEFGEISFTSPSIQFDFNNISITRKYNLLEKITFIPAIAFPFIILFIINPPFIFILILFLFIILSFLINNYKDFDTISIDFSNREIIIQNKLWIVKRVREIFKKKPAIRFEEISHFEFGIAKTFLDTKIKNTLVIKSFDHSPVFIASFNFERDGRRLGELLQYYVVGKPKLIK